jgi:hypothetical protein
VVAVAAAVGARVEVDIIMSVPRRLLELLLLLDGRRGRRQLAADRRDADRGPAEQRGAGGDGEDGKSG